MLWPSPLEESWMRFTWGDIEWFLRFCVVSGIWDQYTLSVILEGLMVAPFEPLESAPEWILTLKVTLLLTLTSLKRVGDLQALSVGKMCMDFVPGLVKVTLRPRPGYVPKVLSASFHSQVVTLHYFHPPPFASGKDERLHMLCPVRALKIYVDRSSFGDIPPSCLYVLMLAIVGLPHRSTEFITGWMMLFRWLMRCVVFLHLSAFGRILLGVWTSSQALFRGVPLEDICVAAVWSSPHTFIRFYNLDLDTAPGSQVLSAWTGRICCLVHKRAR